MRCLEWLSAKTRRPRLCAAMRCPLNEVSPAFPLRAWLFSGLISPDRSAPLDCSPVDCPWLPDPRDDSSFNGNGRLAAPMSVPCACTGDVWRNANARTTTVATVTAGDFMGFSQAADFRGTSIPSLKNGFSFLIRHCRKSQALKRANLRPSRLDNCWRLTRHRRPPGAPAPRVFDREL
jgi:hypothetical protein